MRSSSDWISQPDGTWVRADIKKTRGLGYQYNRTAKSIFKGAAMTVITKHQTDPLYADYQRLLSNGTRPPLALLTIARKIAALVLAMWKRKELYDPKKYRGLK
jgi:hypothetical protein